MDEGGVLHVLCEALQEAERLIKNYWHCNLRELLKRHLMKSLATERKISPFTRQSFESLMLKGKLVFKHLKHVRHLYVILDRSVRQMNKCKCSVVCNVSFSGAKRNTDLEKPCSNIRLI